MDDYKNLIWWLRWMGQVQPGAATYTWAADTFENLQTENAAFRRQIGNLTDAQAAVVKEFDKKLEELHETKSELDRLKTERDAAVADIVAIAKGGRTWMCPYCKHKKNKGYGIADCDLPLGGCKMPYTRFEWRGPQGGGDG